MHQAEAHATDVWFIGKSAGVYNKRHITIEDRAGCAQRFIEEVCIYLFVYYGF